MEPTTAPAPLTTYRPDPARFDELIGEDGRPRDHWAGIATTLDDLGLDELHARSAEATRLLLEDGVVYHAYGASPDPWQEWRLDAIPTIVPSREWLRIEAGIAQRVELLGLVLDDLYGPRDLLRRRLLPASVVFEHPGYLRACHGIRLPTRHQLLSYAADLGRDAGGDWVVLSDRAQAPSGAGYALENRHVMSRVLPSIYRGAGVHRIEPFFRNLRSALVEAAPPGVADPQVVILTPGPWNETAFEHALLSTRLGVPLVEPEDLVVGAGGVAMRSPSGLEPVHVILRRVDAAYCDPLELRPDSQLGVPGLVEATRRGVVSIVNPLGSGALENPALMRFLPEIARHLLGHDLDLACVPSWWGGEERELAHILARAGELVLRPISPLAGREAVHGPGLSAREVDDLRARIQAQPSRWVAQEPMPLSDTPTLARSGLEPRRTLLRAFATARGDDVHVMAGGLTRTAPRGEVGLISAQRGALAKDTWVLTSEPEPTPEPAVAGGPATQRHDPFGALPAGAAENLWWVGRYAERAEATARLMRALSDTRSEYLGGDDPDGLAALEVLRDALAETTNVPRTEQPDPWPELLTGLRERQPGTLDQSLRALLEAAHAVRDQLPGDTWLVIGDVDRRLARLRGRDDVRAPEVQGALQQVLHGLLALMGLTTEGMLQDLAWHFLDAGRRVERAIQVLSLMRAIAPAALRGDPTGRLVLESAAAATENPIMYRRRARSDWSLGTVLDLVVADAGNPRSVAFCLARLEQDLEAVPLMGSRLRRSQRVVLEARTLVRTADPFSLATDETTLLATLDDLLVRLRRAADAVEDDHFLRRIPQREMGRLG